MMRTQRLQADRRRDVEKAATILREGGLVAFATETVYGLGANALSAEAVQGIFEAKERPSWDPLIVHLAPENPLEHVAVLSPDLLERTQTLADAFWPGPLTLLLPRTGAIPDIVTAGRSLVGVRRPAHPATQILLGLAQVPVAAPSANRFGHISPTTADHVLADLDGRIDAVLDAGPCSIGLESTVLDPATTPLTIYRAGAVTVEQIAHVSGLSTNLYRSPSRDAQYVSSLPSPGVGLRHYAPSTPVQITEGSSSALWAAVKAAEREGAIAGVLLPDDWRSQASPQTVVQQWAAWDQHDALANTLFSGLRSLEASPARVILVPLPPPGGIRDALRDRLLKAAYPRDAGAAD